MILEFIHELYSHHFHPHLSSLSPPTPTLSHSQIHNLFFKYYSSMHAHIHNLLSPCVWGL